MIRLSLRDLLIQAKALSHHVAEPAYRHASASYAKTFETVALIEIEGTLSLATFQLLKSLNHMMQAVDRLDDPQAILKTGEAISAMVDAIRANMPKPVREPRRYWTEGERA